MIQTNVFVIALRGVNFDLDPKDMISPRGNENTRVKRNRRTVVPKPSSKVSVTGTNPVVGVKRSSFIDHPLYNAGSARDILPLRILVF